MAKRWQKRFERKLDLILEAAHMAQATIDDVVADVAAESTVDDSIITLLNGLIKQLAAAGTNPVKLQAIHDGLQANIAKITAAVTATPPPA